jgi:serine/threonine protein kinase
MLTQDQLSAEFLKGKSLYLKSYRKGKSKDQISLKDFEIIKPIGSGGFSKVFLCRFKEDGNFYAIKLIDKEVIVKNKKKKIIMNERNIMKQADHPFIIDMKFAF